MTAVSGHEAFGARYWLFSLGIPAAERSALLSALTGEELERGRRLLDRDKGEQFLVGRGLLRKTLSELTGIDAARLVLREGEFGKPYLAQSPGDPPVSFNLSHAGGYLLLAVTQGAEVGVDLEEVRRDLDYEPMARRFLSQREREELFALPAKARLAAFYRCWTRKEAYLKGTGSGFSKPSTAFDVALSPQPDAVLVAHRGDEAELERWSVCDLAVPHGYCAAMAVENLPPSLCTP